MLAIDGRAAYALGRPMVPKNLKPLVLFFRPVDYEPIWRGRGRASVIPNVRGGGEAGCDRGTCR